MMRLLLLLSAFMAALVGQAASARVMPVPVCEVASSASVKAERFVPASRSIRAPDWGEMDRNLGLPADAQPLIAQSAPLYAHCLRI